jgi:hypothetical protein
VLLEESQDVIPEARVQRVEPPFDGRVGAKLVDAWRRLCVRHGFARHHAPCRESRAECRGQSDEADE